MLIDEYRYSWNRQKRGNSNDHFIEKRGRLESSLIALSSRATNFAQKQGNTIEDMTRKFIFVLIDE
jgi:hypothetical protein